MMEVSVIMAEYNTYPAYLKKSIESIICQTFTDFEFIIIDDCGANDVEEIVKSYGDERIRVLKNSTNSGLVHSLNRAIRAARGSYLVRMDTDDIAEPQRIERLYSFITRHDEYAVVGSRVIEFSDNADHGILSKEGERTKKSIMAGEPLIHPSVIMKKKEVLNVGMYPDYKRAEDLALWCELLIAGEKLYVIKDVLLRYRVNPEDYAKRKLKYRKGEILARLHYYPRLEASLRDYFRIFRFIASSVLPTEFVRRYRHAKRLSND